MRGQLGVESATIAMRRDWRYLLIPQVAVGRDENLEPFLLGYIEQLPVLEFRPPKFVSGHHFMWCQ